MHYDAFISYRRSDGSRIAHWLRRELESWRPPKTLPGVAGRQFRIYLDTAYERGTHDFYEQNIRPALLASRYLIVIATPDAVARPESRIDWIKREVRDFTGTPQGRNVLVVRGAGETDGLLPADLNQRFPHVEIIDLRGAGRFSFLNPMRAGRLAHEKLKLVAPLLDLPPQDMPALRMEEERRQQARLGTASGTSLTVLAMVAGASVFAFNSLWTAQDALRSSSFSIEQMIGAIADHLPVEDRPDGVRSSLLNQACDLADKLARQAQGTPAIRERVLCELERAHGREMQKEYPLAESTLVNAVNAAHNEEQRTQSASAGHALLQARTGLVHLLSRLNETERAMVAVADLLHDTRRLASRHPGEPSFALAAADAYLLQAALSDGKGQAAARSTALVQAARHIGEAAAFSEPDPAVLADLRTRQAESLTQAALANLDRHSLADALTLLRESAAIRSGIRWDGTEATMKEVANRVALAELHVTLAQAEAALGHRPQAQAARAEAARYLAQASRMQSLPAELLAYVREVRHKLDALGNEQRGGGTDQAGDR